MSNLTKEQGEAFCNTLNAFNEVWAFRQRQQAYKGSNSTEVKHDEHSYEKLYKALSQEIIQNNIGKEARELKFQIKEAIRSNDFSKADQFLDNITNAEKEIQLFKVADLGRKNVKLSVASKVNNFEKKIFKAMETMMGCGKAL